MNASLGLRRRRTLGIMGQVLTAVCAAIAAGTLVVIFVHVCVEGWRAINPAFLTQVPRPVGVTGGGIGNGIVGSLIMVSIAAAMALPVGILIGIYLAIYGRGPIPEAIRFMSEVLSGVPSIAIGLFAYTLLVQPLGHFSAFSASFAFMLIMLPLVIRTSDDAIRTVPPAVREGALALGLPAYSSVLHVVLPAARPLIVTGALLAIARIAGETAPLLFTAFGSQFWVLNPFAPMAALPLQIFSYAISPYADWHRQAWAGAMVLIGVVILLNLGARWSLRSRKNA